MGASEGSQPGATRQAGRLLAARAISRSSRDPSSWELSLRVGVIQTGAFPRQSYRSLSRSREHGAVQGTAASARHHRVPDPPIWVYTPFCIGSTGAHSQPPAPDVDRSRFTGSGGRLPGQCPIWASRAVTWARERPQTPNLAGPRRTQPPHTPLATRGTAAGQPEHRTRCRLAQQSRRKASCAREPLPSEICKPKPAEAYVTRTAIISAFQRATQNAAAIRLAQGRANVLRLGG